MYINFWYPAEESARITDKPVHVRMLGQDFVLFRDSSGKVNCLSNICSHRGGWLADGKVKDDCIECPYHGWRFDGAGACQRIPSLGPDARIPPRAKVDSYPTEERYGLIFAFLGDLPEDERPTIMPIDEYGAPGWAATLQRFEWNNEYKRSTENALDPAHNEFVHPTHGFSGARDDYYVPELTVRNEAWGVSFMTTYFSPPLKDERMKKASGRSTDAVMEAGSGTHGPSCNWTHIHPTPTSAIHQYSYKTPIDESHVRSFLVNMRNFLPESDHDRRFMERNVVVAEQDAAVLSRIRPVVTPDTRTKETFVPADKVIAAYRDKLKEWEALGWRIDSESVRRSEGKVAYAIPSPSRRREKGWAIDPIPLIKPARDGIAKAAE